MKTHINDTPQIDAGLYISKMLTLHKDKPILLLVSGGSSLAILEYITSESLSPNVTVGLTDERMAQDVEGSNLMQLQNTTFYSEAVAAGVSFLHANKPLFETHRELGERLNTEVLEFYAAFPNCYTIGIFGIGEDGHTASIFPTSESEFQSLYGNENLYTAITQNGIQYPERVTITPTCIEDRLDDVVLFAVGSTKCDNILNYMHNRNFSQYQIPALIPAKHPESVLFTDCRSLV